jgi:hypothetical protein
MPQATLLVLFCLASQAILMEIARQTEYVAVDIGKT